MDLVKDARPSLEYRDSQAEILAGNVPEKYTRILPFVKGRRILEVGAAEGVLSLLLADSKEKVIALEQNQHRHQSACELQKAWKDLGKNVDRCHMVHGNFFDHLELLKDVDTVVSVRCIFYFKESIFDLFKAIGEEIPHVTLCGNAKRGKRFKLSRGRFLKGRSLYWAEKMGLRNILGRGLDPDLGFYERYAADIGMIELLESNHYTITDKQLEGDAIITGEKENF